MISKIWINRNTRVKMGLFSNVIKSFGLQIGGVDTKNKSLSLREEKKTDLRKFKPISQLMNQTEKKIKIK